MTAQQCAASSAADDDLRVIVDSHSRRLDGLEDDVGTLKAGQAATLERLISIEAQGQERERSRAEEARGVRSSIDGLTKQLAEHTGAQKRQNELKEEELLKAQTKAAKVKYWASLIGVCMAILGMLGGTLFSSQTVDNWLFGRVHFLHRYDHTTELAQGGGNASAVSTH